MGLETGTYLNDLVPSNPDGAVDKKFQGDDHIKLIKQVLRNTFPGLAGRAFRIQTKAGNYGAIATDNTSMLLFTAVATLTLPAAAGLGNGHLQFVYAGGGAVTITPTGTETINGVNASLVVPTGTMLLLIGDGVGAFFAMVIPPGPSLAAVGNIATASLLGRITAGTGVTEVLTPAQVRALLKVTGGRTLIEEKVIGTAVGNLDFVTGIDATYDTYDLEFIDLLPNSSTSLYLRFSQDAGATWDATAIYDIIDSILPSVAADASTLTLKKIAADTGAQIANNVANGFPVCGEVNIKGPADAHGKIFKFESWYDNGAQFLSHRGALRYSSNGAINGVRVFVLSGTMTAGKARLYGRRKD